MRPGLSKGHLLPAGYLSLAPLFIPHLLGRAAAAGSASPISIRSQCPPGLVVCSYYPGICCTRNSDSYCGPFAAGFAPGLDAGGYCANADPRETPAAEISRTSPQSTTFSTVTATATATAEIILEAAGGSTADMPTSVSSGQESPTATMGDAGNTATDTAPAQITIMPVPPKPAALRKNPQKLMLAIVVPLLIILGFGGVVLGIALYRRRRQTTAGMEHPAPAPPASSPARHTSSAASVFSLNPSGWLSKKQKEVPMVQYVDRFLPPKSLVRPGPAHESIETMEWYRKSMANPAVASLARARDSWNTDIETRSEEFDEPAPMLPELRFKEGNWHREFGLSGWDGDFLSEVEKARRRESCLSWTTTLAEEK